jgi:hypothetical protein
VEWCERTQADHRADLESEGFDLPFHSSADVTGRGWRVTVCGFTTLEGRPDPDEDSRPALEVAGDVTSATEARALISAVEAALRWLED